jgi:hypothetical protein
MYFFRIFTYILVVGFIAFKAYLIDTEFSGTRVIEVREQIDKNISLPLKGFKADDIPVVTFKSTVTPITFWDKLFLSNEDGCLLIQLLEIAAGLGLVWFVIRLNYDNVFSKRSLNNFALVLWLILMVVTTYYMGYYHTRNYVDDLLEQKNKIDYNYLKRYRIPPFMFLLCCQIPYFWISGLYKVFVDHQTEKAEAVVEGQKD